MNGLDIVFALLSIACFGAAFFIASRPMVRTKDNGVTSKDWRTLVKHQNGIEKPTEILTVMHDETQ
jgi:hypothetical protein